MSSQSEKYRVLLSSPVKCEKVGEVLEVSGIILAAGTYTDRDGKTFHYSKEVLDRDKETFVGVPILYPHTEEKESATDILSKIGGFSTETWVEDNNLWYRGIVYKKDLVEKALTGEVNSQSVEAGVEATLDSELGVPNVISMRGEAIALTNKPACHTCQLRSKKVATSVQLEESEGAMLLSPSGPLEFEDGSRQRVTHPQKRTGERVKLSFEEEEPGEPSTPEAVLKEIAKLAQYPGPSKPWAEMSAAEKEAACKATGFMKTKGERAEYDAPTMKALAFAMKAVGIPQDKIQAALKKLKEKYPYPAPTKSEEFDVDSLFTETPEMTDLRQEKEKLEKELKDMKEAKAKAELDGILAEVKKLDTTFDDKAFFEEVTCTLDKIKLAKKYKTQLERLQKPVTVRGISDTAKDHLNRISLETFNMTPDQLLQEVAPEMFTKKEEK